MSVKLFTPLKIRELEIKNRIFVSPMCQYSAHDGVPNAWHSVHLGSRAVGGAGLVMTEASGVSAVGRISPGDTGIYSDAQVKAFSEITKFIKEQGAVAGMQLAHAGRKASTGVPWSGKSELTVGEGGWVPLAPSDKSFSTEYPAPKEMTVLEIKETVQQFLKAAENALRAGFQVVEIHSAHGYLLHEFLSPLSNFRKDEFGGSLENRMRFPLQVAAAVRESWPSKWPVFVRISATDWIDGGWDIAQSISYSRELKELGIDFIDCSSGGVVPHAKIPVGPGYQVPFAKAIRSEVDILTGAVGMITDAEQAEKILNSGEADAVLLARELLRDPYWPLHAAKELGHAITWPKQYERAK